MIGKLKGTLDEINQDHIILDVCGVGYKVFLSSSTLNGLNEKTELILNIEMHIREDQMLLYGFNSKLEQKWFNLLQKVQGVGSRMALTILSNLKPDQLYYAIISEDIKIIKSISGIGPKIATRIINELKGHSEITINSTLGSHLQDGGSGNVLANITADNVLNDALDALTTLGFQRAHALKVLSDIRLDNDAATLEELIRQALAKLASNR